MRAAYTPDITPLTLAAHKNNYEILKILIDRGAALPLPHDIKCNCEECRADSKRDSLRFSMSRLNAYKALASPSLIALTSKDPILTAFKLSDQLKNLSKMESQFCKEYTMLREQVQSFATSLLDHARSSYELEVMLNYNNEETVWSPGLHQTLERLKLAIKCKQKSFVAHPKVQQMLSSIWYEGVPSFRRVHILHQSFIILKLCILYPYYCIMYMLAPHSQTGTGGTENIFPKMKIIFSRRDHQESFHQVHLSFIQLYFLPLPTGHGESEDRVPDSGDTRPPPGG